MQTAEGLGEARRLENNGRLPVTQAAAAQRGPTFPATDMVITRIRLTHLLDELLENLVSHSKEFP